MEREIAKFNEDYTRLRDEVGKAIVDQAAPVKPPKPEPAADLSDKDLASLSRELAANDPQTLEVTSGGGPGKKNDRNVELIVRNPLRLAQK